MTARVTVTVRERERKRKKEKFAARYDVRATCLYSFFGIGKKPTVTENHIT